MTKYITTKSTPWCEKGVEYENAEFSPDFYSPINLHPGNFSFKDNPAAYPDLFELVKEKTDLEKLMLEATAIYPDMIFELSQSGLELLLTAFLERGIINVEKLKETT